MFEHAGELGSDGRGEAEAEERVDDEVVGVDDEVRHRREERQEGQVHPLTLAAEALKQGLGRLLRVEH